MAGSQDMMMMMMMMMMMSSVFAVLAGGTYFINQPKEGDICKGTSVGGNYVIDENGDCVLDYCDSGYTRSGGGCTFVIPDDDEEEDKEDEDEDEDEEEDEDEGVELPVGRYVRFTFHEDGPSDVLTPNEIRVFDKNNLINLALNRSTEVSGVHRGRSWYQGSKAVDGDLGTLWHSDHSDNPSWIEIDLGYEDEISKIEIVNQPGGEGDEYTKRMSGGGENSADKGSYVIIKNTNGDVIKTTADIKFVAEGYSYDFTDEDPKWKSFTP